jgi:rod shape-determining protein MreC
MRNLLQFLKKFRDFLIFVILQVFVLTIFFNSKFYHKAKMVNTSSSLVGWFIEKKYNITKHFGLEQANLDLLNQNAKLLALMPESFYQLQSDIYYVNDTLMQQQYRYIPATVLNSNSNKRNNYFTINSGSIQGVKTGMGVISAEGAIGIVTDVSERFAIVMTLLSDNIQVNVKLKTNNEYWLLNWDGLDKNIVQVENVKRDVNFELGDKVVTRGGATQFPEGIPVGKIIERVSEDGEQTISINIELAVNFNSVYHVFVVENLLKQEQLTLEERIFEDNE